MRIRIHNKKVFGVFLIGLAVVLFIAYILLRGSIAAYYYAKSQAEITTSGNLQNADRFIARALWWKKTDLYYRTRSQIKLAELNVLLSSADQKSEVVQEQFKTVFGDAQTAAKKATELNKDGAENWLQLGDVYRVMVTFTIEGAYEQSLAAYTKARIILPQNAVPLLKIAELSIVRNDFAKAKSEIIDVIKLDPKNQDAFVLLAQVETKLGDVQAAINATEKAIELAPDSPSLYFQSGFLKYELKQYGAAAQALQKSIELSPGYANARYYLGLAYFYTGRIPEAIGQFEELKKISPDAKNIDLMLENMRAGKDPFTAGVNAS